MSEEIPKIKDLLLERWLVLKGRPRKNLHISSILHCKRRAVFEHLNPKPPAIDERKIKYFLGGEIKHVQIQSLLGEEWECEREVIHTTESGIHLVAHPDAVWRKQDLVLEIKSTESTKVGHEPYSYHVKQLLYYMAILDIPKGVLLYIILGNTYRVSDYFPEYHIFRTTEQRREILDKIDKEATELQAAIDIKDANAAPHVADDLTYLDRRGTSNWFCETCPYRSQCSAYQEFFGPQDGRPLDQSKLLTRTVERLKQTMK